MEVNTQTDWSFSPHVFLPDPSSLLFWSPFPPPPPDEESHDEDEFCDAFNYFEITISKDLLLKVEIDSNQFISGQVSPLSESGIQVGDQILQVTYGSIRKQIVCEDDMKEIVSRIEKLATENQQEFDECNLIVARLNPNHDHDMCLQRKESSHVHLLNPINSNLIGGLMKEQDSMESYLVNEMKELEKECQGFMKDLESITCQEEKKGKLSNMNEDEHSNESEGSRKEFMQMKGRHSNESEGSRKEFMQMKGIHSREKTDTKCNYTGIRDGEKEKTRKVFHQDGEIKESEKLEHLVREEKEYLGEEEKEYLREEEKEYLREEGMKPSKGSDSSADNLNSSKPDRNRDKCDQVLDKNSISQTDNPNGRIGVFNTLLDSSRHEKFPDSFRFRNSFLKKRDKLGSVAQLDTSIDTSYTSDPRSKVIPIIQPKCWKKGDTSLPKYDPKDKKESIKNWIKSSLENSLKLRKEKWSSKACSSKVAICQPNPRPLCQSNPEPLCQPNPGSLFQSNPEPLCQSNPGSLFQSNPEPLCPMTTHTRLTSDQSTQMSNSSSDSCKPVSSRIYEEIDPIINKVVLGRSTMENRVKCLNKVVLGRSTIENRVKCLNKVVLGRSTMENRVNSPVTRIQKSLLAPINQWPSTMYTNRANLQHTIYLQQQLLKLSLGEKGKSVEPTFSDEKTHEKVVHELPTTREWPLLQEAAKRRKKSSLRKSSSFQYKRNSVPNARMPSSNSAQFFDPKHPGASYDEDDHIRDEDDHIRDGDDHIRDEDDHIYDEDDHIYDEVSPEDGYKSFVPKAGTDCVKSSTDSVREGVDHGRWKVKRRPDGTRYVTRDEVRPKLMSEARRVVANRDTSLLDRVRHRQLTSLEKKRMSMVREEGQDNEGKNGEILTVATV